MRSEKYRRCDLAAECGRVRALFEARSDLPERHEEDRPVMAIPANAPVRIILARGVDGRHEKPHFRMSIGRPFAVITISPMRDAFYSLISARWIESVDCAVLARMS